MGLLGQTYQQLWKQVDAAQQKDLPQTAIRHLQTIEKKARKEKAYGQLLKSTLLCSRLQAEVSSDSLRPAVDRLEQQLETLSDNALAAVYATVLSKVYAENRQLGDDSEQKSLAYFKQATAHPEHLAGVNAQTYVPFVIAGDDSEAFGDDLLSVVGWELEAWQWMKDYYQQVNNRRALCHLALRTANSISEFDSLSELYGDLPEAKLIARKRQNLWTVQTNPTFQVMIPKRVVMPQESQVLQLRSLRNIQQLTMRVFRTSLTGDTSLNPEDKADYGRIKEGMVELKEQQRTSSFSGHAENEMFTDSLTLKGLPVGVYLLEFSSPGISPTRSLYFVSGLRLMAQAMPQEAMRYVVVDARSGQPVPHAKLNFLYYTGRRSAQMVEQKTTNEQGEIVVKQGNRRPSSVYVMTAQDKYSPSVNAYGRYSYYERQYNQVHTSLYTDRSIYRPGQNVFVTAIMWQEQSAIEQAAVSNKQLTISLRDANYKVVAEHQVTTDRYGKCTTAFVLPTGLLNGRFTIRANGANASISVEEYKRPSFYVEFPAYQESYQQGDTVHAQAKAVTYAGVPVQGGKVHYVVKRRVAYWWMSYYRYWQGGYVGRGVQETVLNEADTTTGDDGSFVVDMPMLLPEDMEGHSMFYHFVVEADVTDVAGETHQGSMTLPLGTKATVLTCNIPQQVRRDQLPQVTFHRYNAAGKEIVGELRYRLDNGRWKEVAVNQSLAILPSSLKSGAHRLQAVCGQDSLDVSFVVFALDDKKVAAPTHDWFYVSDNRFPSDGSPVTLQVGSSDPDLHVVYGIYAGDEVIESGTVQLDGKLLNRQFTYQQRYGNGLLLTFAWVKDGKCYIHRETITRPVPDKRLKLTWETFRDRLTPGQQEEWRLKIVKPDGQPADASLMAVLYDKSLDQLQEHSWSFQPEVSLALPSTSWQWRNWGMTSCSASRQYTLQDIPAFDYSHFDNSVYPYYRRSYLMAGGVLMRNHTGAVPMELSVQSSLNESVSMMDASDEVMMAKAETSKEIPEEQTGAKQTGEKQAEEDVQLRENLNETAFCYPSLVTDQQGGVSLKFTLPESLTTWRFMGIAHTVDMLCGKIEGEAVARKDVMVQPNVPRFLRMGDEAQLSARIANTSDKAVSGQARIQLLNTVDNALVAEQSQPFTVAAGQTVGVTFTIPSASLHESLLVCKVFASGEGFSDGEQHYLPVLSDREYVTKTVPYTQHEPGVKTIDLKTLFPQGTTQQKLTIEYTNNPAWLMVQSLPILGQPCEHSAIDQAASYYSNLLAKTLMDQSPQVKTVFAQWQQEKGQETTLESQLQKNQELKDLLLNETPWVAEADRETEQKQRLSDFFDENTINHRLSAAVEKLLKLQNGDGSFSWYPGMEGSTSITVAVEEMLVRLNQMAGQQQQTSQMQTKAFDFLGEEMVDLVNEMKKQEKKGHRASFPSFTALRWLYLCALDGRQLPAKVRSANDYLVKLLKQDIKRQTIYEKALTAVVLAKRGERRTASSYVQSLKEYTVYTDEMGRYYDTHRASYSWYDYKIPTEVAAIEAIQLVTPQDKQTIDEMRRWLLQEKRTQSWDTPINTVNAIYAFLMNQQPLQLGQTQTELAVDGKTLQLPKATAGVGYVKTSIDSPQGQTFTATKQSEGTSWGAVYAQFLQQTSAVAVSQSGISVRREFLTPEGKPIQGPLAIGDKVRVRITIEASRDMDFVQVVDGRAACMEPIRQLSGYHQGAYVTPKDVSTNYFYGGLSKGKHTIETEYFIDRAGRYETGTCLVQCAYAPEYRAVAPSVTLIVK